ncbi:MAG: hypothetical protein AAGJ73_05680 [Pseudomonadota bacterium]
MAREAARPGATAMAFAAILSLTPVVAVFAHRGAGVIAVAMGLAAAAHVQVWRTGVRTFLLKPDFTKPLVLGAAAFLLLCAWIALSGAWSPQGNALRLALVVLTPALAAGTVIWRIGRLTPESLRLVAGAYVIVAAVAAAALIFESQSGAFLRAITPPVDASPLRFKDLTAVSRGVTLVTPLLFPALAIVAAQAPSRRGGALAGFAALAALLALGAVKLGVVSNAVALGFGTAAAAAAFFWPRATLNFVLFSYVTFLLVSPFAAAWLPVEAIVGALGESFPASWGQRLFAWREAAQAAFHCLPFGCGADAARALHAAGETVSFQGSILPLAIMPTHPHSVFLQVWMELGAAGALLFGLVIMMGGIALIRVDLPKEVASATAGAGIALLVFFAVEMSIWQFWRLGGLALAAIGVALSYYVNHFSVYKRKERD